MKLDYVIVSGFRGFRGTVRLNFAQDFTIIDGRNGVGKSTIFDAVEFALTGELTKYRDAQNKEKKSDSESVRDYIWWRGEGQPANERFVEIGLSNALERIKVRRTPFDEPTAEIEALGQILVDSEIAPEMPLSALCASSIIRDEHIADLSLNLPDIERYRLLRQAIGASDGTSWLNRAGSIKRAAQDRARKAGQEVERLADEVTRAERLLDEVRASQPSDEAMTDARYRLTLFTGAPWTRDSIGRARNFVARLTERANHLRSLEDTWPVFSRSKEELTTVQDAVRVAAGEVQRAQERVLRLDQEPRAGAGVLSSAAAELTRLIELGRKVGRQEDCCPLCSTLQTEAQFQEGTERMLEVAKKLDQEATAAAQAEAERSNALVELDTAKKVRESAERRVLELQTFIADFEKRFRSVTDSDLTADTIQFQLRNALELQEDARSALSILATAENLQTIKAAEEALENAQAQLAEAEKKAGRARQLERSAVALDVAVNRAANETLKLRLERVLPLMAELYQRLRPHPHWRDISYSLRGGDIRQFLKLEVGDSLNPQFLFSSGQRRATGLAFLLSINLSLAWSRWQTVLLDDPVQHVDDFRAVHLAEVLAHIVEDGRQVICAVEDGALADLLGRRLPVRTDGHARRVTLAMDSDGTSSVSVSQDLRRLPQGAFSAVPQSVAS